MWLRLGTFSFVAFIGGFTDAYAQTDLEKKIAREDLVDDTAYVIALMGGCDEQDRANILLNLMKDLGVIFAYDELNSSNEELHSDDPNDRLLAAVRAQLVYADFTGIFATKVFKERAEMRVDGFYCDNARVWYRNTKIYLQEVGKLIYGGPDWRAWAKANNVFQLE